MRKRIWPLILLPLCVVLAALAYQGGRWLENRNQPEPVRGDYRERLGYDAALEMDGVAYRRRKNLTSILLMGVDRDAPGIGNRGGGQADFLRLIVLDSTAGTVTQVQIDRDTMTPITILGILGDRSGVRTAQICLSHGYGDGGAQSCQLTADAVSNLLFGAPVDFYIAMNLSGIAALNDQVGGVTVTLEDDFSALDPAMTPGTTLTLHGKQAEYYVRSRKDVGSGTNQARMKRQQAYLNKLSDRLAQAIAEDANYAGDLYDALEDYLTTDISRGRLINEVWNAREFERLPLIELAGQHRVGEDGFMQFIVDEDALKQVVLDLFYEPIS